MVWPGPQRSISINPRLFDWQGMSYDDVYRAYLDHGNQALIETLKKLGILKLIVSADKDTVTDSEGKRYCNGQGGYGSTPFGGALDFMTEALWGDKLPSRPPGFQNTPSIIHAAMTKPQGALLRLLAEIAPGQITRFQPYNSGTEAVDNLLQAVFFACGMGTIITAIDGYHGKSGLTRLATPQSFFMRGLDGVELTYPGVDGCREPVFVQAPYGNVPALESAIIEHKAKAVLLEPLQGEAGAIRPPKGYLRDAERVCRANGALVLYDEVQVGFGRLGTMWGCQLDADEYWQPDPDGIAMAKALGGGYTAAAAIGLKDTLWQKAYGGQEGMLRISTTAGGNPNTCIVGINSIQRITSLNLPQAAKEMGEYLDAKFEPLRSEKRIKKITGAGLLWGIEFNIGVEVDKVAQLAIMMFAREMINRGVIPVVSLARQVLRIEPPLEASKECIDEIIAVLTKVVKLYSNPLKFAAAMVKAGANITL